MSPERVLFAFLSLSVARIAAAPAPGHGTCGLLKNTAIEKFKLSMLTPLFGELLTTESNGDKYVVSVCSPIPQIFHDPRKLAGAVKITADGYSIELGRIDLSNIVVNENDIVLTYDGGDIDKNPKDTCKGLRWNTYVTFTCDPYTNKDILILKDEDGEQPEICQVWFEVKTKKICDRQPYMALKSLENDLSNKEKEIHEKEESGKNGIYFNKIAHKDNPFNIENIQLGPHKIFPKTEINEIKSNKTDFKIISSEFKPFMSLTPNLFNKQEPTSSREIEIKHFSPKMHLFNNENINIVEKNEKLNEEIKHENLTPAKHIDHLFINKSTSDYKSKTNLQDTKLETDQLRNIVEPEFFMSSENRISKVTPFMPNIMSSKNIVLQDTKLENDQLRNIVEPEFFMSFENKTSKVNQFMPNIMSSRNIVPSDKTNVSDNSNQNGKSSEDVNTNSEEQNKTKIIPEETSPRNESQINIPNQNTPEGQFFNEEHNLLNKSLEIKPSNNENNSSTAIHLTNEETETKSNINELNNSYKNRSDNENESKQNSTQFSDLENEQLKTFNSTINGIKPNINLNSTSSQKNNSEESLSKNNIDNTYSTNTQIKSDDNTSTKDNGTTVENKIEPSQENLTKSYDKNDNSTVNGEIITTGFTVKPSNNSQPNTTFNYYPNKFSEVNNTQYVKTPVDESETNKIANENQINSVTENTESTKVNNTQYVKTPINESETNKIADENQINSVTKNTESTKVNNTQYVKTPIDESETNKVADVNQINKITENAESTKSSEPNSNQNSLDSNNVLNSSDKSLNTTDNSKLASGFSFSSLYSKLCPNGIHLSAATIFGGLGSLLAVFMLVGAAVNRFYYKKTGTDQIPFKGFFTSIITYIKLFISKICCCCNCGDLQASDTLNEKTPLRDPTNIEETTVKKERRKRNIDDGSYNGSKNSDDDNNGGGKKKDGYGSMSEEDRSSIFGSKAENVSKTEINLKSEPVNDKGESKLSTLFRSKVIPAVKNIFERTGKNIDTIVEKQKKEITEFAEKNIKPQLDESQKEKLANIEQDVGKAVEKVEQVMSTANASLNENMPTSSGSKDVEKKISSGDKDTTEFDEKNKAPHLNGSQNEKSADIERDVEKAVEKVEQTMSTASPNENKSADAGGGKEEKPVNGGLSNGARKDAEDEAEQEPDSLFPFVNPSAVVSKTDEAKRKFFAADGNESADERNAESDEDGSLTEYVEEIVYVDAKDGDQDEEEIVEEIVETTTRESPDSPSGGVVVTKTTRKVSSSAHPGVVSTTEETKVSSSGHPDVVSTTGEISVQEPDDGGKTRKRSFGLKLGIGKSGVNVSVGEKKIGVGLSGVKFGKKPDEPDAVSVGLDGTGLKLQGPASPPKKSSKKPNFNPFKRSTSQPSDDGDVADDYPDALPGSAATVPRKKSLGSAGLLIFGKSRSKSTGLLEADDSDNAVTDVGVLSDFIDQERSASSLSLDRSASVQSLTDGGDGTQPAPESGDLDVQKTGAAVEPKSTKKAKKKSDGEKKSKK